MDTSPVSTPVDAEESRITALVALLADDDPQVGATISDHLREVGPHALPSLLDALDSPNDTLRERADTLVQALRGDQAVADLRQFSEAGAASLEEGLFLLARLNTPELTREACLEPVDRMTEDLMLRLDPGDGIEPMLSAWARYLYGERGFSGNADDYYNPENSYLNTVLASGKGIPISLSCLYLILAHRLGLPMMGIGMPGHFLVKYDDGTEMRLIDPFHHGRLLDKEGCGRLLRGLGLNFDDRYLQSVDTRYILERTLKNLVSHFSEQNQPEPLALHQRALAALNNG